MQKVKTIIADDHALFITGIQSLLKGSPEWEFEIVATAQDGDELISTLRKVQAELLLLDLNMPNRDGLEVLSTIRKAYPQLRIITLTMYDDPKIVKSAFKAGADGYVLKTTNQEELLTAINDVMEGHRFFGEGVKLHDLEMMNGTKPKKVESTQYEDNFIRKYNLTKRELEILKLIGRAMSNKEIAQTLYISDQTVSVHRKNIMRKLGVSNTAGLMRIAYDNALI
jgi:DNA-binding NarL/FixJ family response regulator